MGSKNAAGRVTSGFGGLVEVKWQLDGGKVLDIEIKAPPTTSGIFELGAKKQLLGGKSKYRLIIIV